MKLQLQGCAITLLFLHFYYYCNSYTQKPLDHRRVSVTISHFRKNVKKKKSYQKGIFVNQMKLHKSYILTGWVRSYMQVLKIQNVSRISGWWWQWCYENERTRLTDLFHRQEITQCRTEISFVRPKMTVKKIPIFQFSPLSYADVCKAPLTQYSVKCFPPFPSVVQKVPGSTFVLRGKKLHQLGRSAGQQEQV